jgi:hypothetical protein
MQHREVTVAETGSRPAAVMGHRQRHDRAQVLTHWCKANQRKQREKEKSGTIRVRVLHDKVTMSAGGRKRHEKQRC